MIALHPLFLAEARRFPGLIRSNYDDGAPRDLEPLLSYFRKAASEGILRIDDVAFAAEQFTSLVLAPIQERLPSDATSACRRPDIARPPTRGGWTCWRVSESRSAAIAKKHPGQDVPNRFDSGNAAIQIDLAVNP